MSIDLLCKSIDWFLYDRDLRHERVKDTHKENAPSNKRMNLGIWVVGTLNQLLLRGSFTETKFSKNKVVCGKTPFFVIGPFCTPLSICLNINL